MTETNYQITADHAAEMLIRTATIPDRRGQTQDKPSAIPCHSVPPRDLGSLSQFLKRPAAVADTQGSISVPFDL